jgi:acetyl-CoA carboxylase biotin carboxyl carrier protein
VETKEIRELIELISTSGFTTFELEREGFRIRLVRSQVSEPFAAQPPAAGALAPAVASPAEPPAAAPPREGRAEPQAQDGLYEMPSPIVGTFYRAAGADLPPFVEVGSRIKKGQVLCIVEAMKVMNEIESEIDAEVVEIAIANGQPVEFGEVLFRLRPTA